MSLEEYYNYLLGYDIVSEETLDVVTSINGYNEKTLDDVLYVKTGYRDIEQYLEYEDQETYREYYGDDDEDDEEDDLEICLF